MPRAVGSDFPNIVGIDQRALLDDVGNRIKVQRVGFAPQAQRFQRDGPAAGEHVQHAGARGAAREDVLHGDGGLAGRTIRRIRPIGWIPRSGRQRADEPLGMGLEDVPPGFLDGA